MTTRARGRDAYDVLGVPRDATESELKRAYRELAHRHHPDKNPDDPAAEERFKEIAIAYGVLSDAEQRARYDRMGQSEREGALDEVMADLRGTVQEVCCGWFSAQLPSPAATGKSIAPVIQCQPGELPPG